MVRVRQIRFGDKTLMSAMCAWIFGTLKMLSACLSNFPDPELETNDVRPERPPWFQEAGNNCNAQDGIEGLRDRRSKDILSFHEAAARQFWPLQPCERGGVESIVIGL